MEDGSGSAAIGRIRRDSGRSNYAEMVLISTTPACGGLDTIVWASMPSRPMRAGLPELGGPPDRAHSVIRQAHRHVGVSAAGRAAAKMALSCRLRALGLGHFHLRREGGIARRSGGPLIHIGRPSWAGWAAGPRKSYMTAR